MSTREAALRVTFRATTRGEPATRLTAGPANGWLRVIGRVLGRALASPIMIRGRRPTPLARYTPTEAWPALPATPRYVPTLEVAAIPAIPAIATVPERRPAATGITTRPTTRSAAPGRPVPLPAPIGRPAGAPAPWTLIR